MPWYILYAIALGLSGLYGYNIWLDICIKDSVLKDRVEVTEVLDVPYLAENGDIIWADDTVPILRTFEERVVEAVTVDGSVRDVDVITPDTTNLNKSEHDSVLVEDEFSNILPFTPFGRYLIVLGGGLTLVYFIGLIRPFKKY